MGPCQPGCIFVLKDIRTHILLFSMYGACPPSCIFALQDIRTYRLCRLFSMYGGMSTGLYISFVRYKNTWTVFVCFLGMGACPPGWIQFGTSCYHFRMDEKFTRTEAEVI